MNLKSTLIPPIAAAMLLAGAATASAQAVIFPQAQQPGAAAIAADGSTWTLSNDLLTATFTEADGHLIFGGCPQMGLLPGSDLFRVCLADGTTLTSSDMEQGAVTATPLAANPSAPRGSERFAGHKIETVFTHGDLSIVWRAVLRDGSHYLRTEMELSSPSKATAMNYIVPMAYDLADGEPQPQVVGNTRGAVIMGDKIFAGLETPMGINTVGVTDDVKYPVSSAGASDFNFASWTPTSFSWTPGADLPKSITDLDREPSQVVGTYGAVNFTEAGDNVISFVYTSGSHGLNILGVDLVGADGTIVSYDYHIGFSGDAKTANAYTVKVPAPGTYTLRYFMSLVDRNKRAEEITSSGNITFSKPVTAAGASTSVALPLSGRDHYYVITDQRSSRYVAEEAGGVLQGRKDFDSAEARWHFIARADGTWDIVNSATGNYIVATAPYNRQLTTAAAAPAQGWEIKSAGNDTQVIIACGSAQIHITDGSNGFKVFNWGGGSKTNDGGCVLSLGETCAYDPSGSHFEGRWNRSVDLAPGKTWKVGAVVGLVAPGQQRRSFLAYSERERAVAWHAMPIYNSWYELNINRNNDPNYVTNFNINQCVEVVEQWHRNLYTRHGANIGAFVWDDGWDNYGTWTFNPNFPNGFSEADKVARDMNTGIGAWLGPVGGYGQSGNYRRNYWNGKGGMQLSNPAYYKTFLDAVSMLTSSYDFRYFKFDGISAQFSSVGPDSGVTGEENAEAIIDIEQRVREIKPDIYLNTTVGTWASPFWFQYSDAVWRQENDFGKAGPGDDREQWITYRDNLVHQNYVVNSPICPINNLMTHGFILTRFGAVSKTMDYEGIRRELRCAFACGSGQVELYADFKLLNEIADGALWGDIADCIRWQDANADVLPDAHWVGGDPWTGSKAEVYGWAAWNGRRATLALRNGADERQNHTFTLREALDIPAYVNTTVTLSPAFADIPALRGLEYGKPVDIDEPITVQLPAHSVYVLDGVDNNPSSTAIETVGTDAPAPARTGIYDLAGRRLESATAPGIYIIDGRKTVVR